MKAISTIAGCVGFSVLLAAPAFAQTTTAAQAPANQPAQQGAQQAATAPSGSLEKYHDKWRASKLVGSNVYNQNGQTVGSIDDLLVGEDGKISDAVLSVGGFLGIGGKLVSVPFEQFKFQQSRRDNAAAGAAGSPAATGAGVGAGAGTAAGMAAGTAAGTAAPAANRGGNAQEPTYYSIILPDATKNTLTSAAEFRYNG